MPEDLQRQWDGTEGADQEQRPTDGPALIRGEAIRQQEAETGAKSRTSASDQDKFRQRNSCFSHSNTPLIAKLRCCVRKMEKDRPNLGKGAIYVPDRWIIDFERSLSTHMATQLAA
jgi:hypothetical protein